MKKLVLMVVILFIHSQILAEDSHKTKDTTNISDQLKILQELYKSGVLSGYEYEKEKKKILNN